MAVGNHQTQSDPSVGEASIGYSCADDKMDVGNSPDAMGEPSCTSGKMAFAGSQPGSGGLSETPRESLHRRVFKYQSNAAESSSHCSVYVPPRGIRFRITYGKCH